jgi:D-inositol-3-phosphate glycosyltransferase
LQSLLAFLHPSFEVLSFAINYTGEAIEEAYRILPNRLIGDILGRAQLPEILNAFEPQAILLCHDCDFYAVHHEALSEYRRQHPEAQVFFYCPVEFANMPAGNFKHLADVDVLVFYSEFGLKVVERAFETLGLAPPCRRLVLPHGVDTEIFQPLMKGDFAGSRRQARAQLFPEQAKLQNAFIVLNANRNIKRKRVDLTLEAFADFARDKADVYLYLHMGMRDYGYDILEIAERLGIGERLLLTTTEAAKPVISDEQMNLIYNACDVGLNTAMGEGWGLTAFEHAATGAAQLVPNHSACADLWKENGVVIPLDESQPLGPVVSVAETVNALNELYEDRKALEALSGRAFRYVTLERFAWREIARQWLALFA